MLDVLDKIVFPVFVIGKEDPIIEDGASYFYYIKVVKEGDDEDKILYIDDKKCPGSNLARRRLWMKTNGRALKKLKRALFYFHDLVKVAKGATWFIDSNGLIFKYKKTLRLPIEYKKVKKVIHSGPGVVLVELEGVATRFKILYAPNPTQKYAGVLRMSMGYILYGFFEEPGPSTWKMI